MASGARSKRPRKYVDQSFLHSKSTTLSSDPETSSESAGPSQIVPAMRVPSTPSGISPKDMRKKPSTDSGTSYKRTWERPLLKDFEFGRSRTPPSPRTKEAEERVRRFLMNEAPPVPQDAEEKVNAIESAQVAKRMVRPTMLRIASKSKALEPGHPSAGLGISYAMPEIPEKNVIQTEVREQADEEADEKGNHDKIPVEEVPSDDQTATNSMNTTLPQPAPQNQAPRIPPKSPKVEIHKLQKSPTKSERNESEKPRGILKTGPGYAPKMQSTANSNFGFWAVMFTLNMVGILSALEATILSTSLPTIVNDLGGDGLYTWAVNAYFLSSTVFQPLYAQMANAFGHRWLVLGAVALFASGSAVCGAAVNMQMLVGGRAIQGIGGGGITMLVDLIVQDLVPIQQRKSVLAITFLILTVGNGVGPFVGGVIVEEINWSWIFLINLPAAALTLILLFVFLKESGKRQPAKPNLKRIDFIGNILFIASMTSLLFGLTDGGAQYSWSSWETIVPLALGGIGMTVFTLYEFSAFCTHPLVPLSLFGNRTSAAAFVLSFLHSLVTIWIIYFLPVYFQGVQANSPSIAGIQLLPTVLVMVLAAALSGKLLTYVGHYRPMHFAGFAMLTAGLGLFTMLKINSSPAMWIGFQVLTATGGGIVIRCLLPAVLAGLTERQAMDATATWGFIRNFGIMWGVAIPSVLFNNQIDGFAPFITNTAVRAKLVGGRAYELATAAFLGTLSKADATQVRESVADSLQGVWYVATGIAGFAFLLVLFEADIPLYDRTAQLPAGVKSTPRKFDVEANYPNEKDERTVLITPSKSIHEAYSKPATPHPVSKPGTPHSSTKPPVPPSSTKPPVPPSSTKPPVPPSSTKPAAPRPPLELIAPRPTPVPSQSDQCLLARPVPLSRPTLPSRPSLPTRPSLASNHSAARPVLTTHRLRSRYASIPIMLDEANEPEEPSPISDLPDLPGTPNSTVPTPPEFEVPPPRIRAPWIRRNSWAPWAARRSVESAQDEQGSWYGGSNAEKEVTPVTDQPMGSRSAAALGSRVTRVLGQIPRELEEELSQIGEWESHRRSTSTFNFVV